MTDRSPVERALGEGHFFCPMQLTWLSPELREADRGVEDGDGSDD